MIRSDFSRLLSASKILAANGDACGAKALIEAAAALVPSSDAGLCGKCIKRRREAVDALCQSKASLADGAAGDEQPPIAR
jgi:hypothetical protein